jgi:hypothetical protein
MDSQKPERFLSVKEFAFLVCWSEDTIRRMIYRKIIRAVILPQENSKRQRQRRVWIRECEVRWFIERHANLG